LLVRTELVNLMLLTCWQFDVNVSLHA